MIKKFLVHDCPCPAKSGNYGTLHGWACVPFSVHTVSSMPPSFKGGPCIRKICCGRSAFFLAQTGPPVPVHQEAQHEGRENAIICHKMLQPPCQAIQTNSKRVKGWKIKTRKAMMSRRQIKIDQAVRSKDVKESETLDRGGLGINVSNGLEWERMIEPEHSPICPIYC
jgi:hypothetical protein